MSKVSGLAVGLTIGFGVVGLRDGLGVGAFVGLGVGALDGVAVGTSVGVRVGAMVGRVVGMPVVVGVSGITVASNGNGKVGKAVTVLTVGNAVLEVTVG